MVLAVLMHIISSPSNNRTNQAITYYLITFLAKTIDHNSWGTIGLVTVCIRRAVTIAFALQKARIDFGWFKVDAFAGCAILMSRAIFGTSPSSKGRIVQTKIATTNTASSVTSVAIGTKWHGGPFGVGLAHAIVTGFVGATRKFGSPLPTTRLHL
jgi:hypothetical protein